MDVSYMTVNLGELVTIDPNDPYMKGILRTGINFNAGFGGLIYSKKFYAGYSMPNVAKTNFLNRNMTNFVDTRFGHIAYAGGTFALNENVDIRPNAVFRSIKGTPFNLDLNTVFTFNKNFDFGISCQVKSSIGAIVGLQMRDHLYLAYSYSFPTNKLNQVTIQSHELALRYRIINKSDRSVNPRYFI